MSSADVSMTPEVAQEREQLRDALIAAQESAAVQVLLEACLPLQQESKGLLNELREVQCIICTYLHQKFIADPGLVKLVHFQGYPSQLVSVTVAGIPSMHICLDFIPELIAQPNLHQQIFAIELVSHLSLQYALPKSLNIAKLAVSVMNTLLNVLSHETRPDFFINTLPSLARISRAFPPLIDDVVSLLVQLGKICTTHLANAGAVVLLPREDGDTEDVTSQFQPKEHVSLLSKHYRLSEIVHETFKSVANSTVIVKDSQ